MLPGSVLAAIIDQRLKPDRKACEERVGSSASTRQTPSIVTSSPVPQSRVDDEPRTADRSDSWPGQTKTSKALGQRLGQANYAHMSNSTLEGWQNNQCERASVSTSCGDC